MATNDQLQRLASPRFDFQMRFYIGGPYLAANLDNIVAGQTYTIASATTLTADVDENSTSIPVVSTAAFTTGTIIIGPGDSGEYYEPLTYGSKTSTTFDDLTRDIGDLPAERLRHSSGAYVMEWFDITDMVLRLPSLSVEERQSSVVDWMGSIEGIGYNSAILANDRAILGMWRFRPKDGALSTWTDWWTAFIGFIHSVQADDTNKKEKRWSAQIGSVGAYVDATDTNAHWYGKIDLATNKSTETSSDLMDPWLERLSGEYIGYPDLTGDNAVDGDLATLWISDDEPTSTPESPIDSGLTINEVYLLSPPGYPDDDFRWIELHCMNAFSAHNITLVAKCTTWQWAGWEPDARIPANNYVYLGDMPHGEDFAIVCSNKARFLERWPECDKVVFDWRQGMVGDFDIDPERDFLALHWHGSTRRDIVWFRNNDTYPGFVPYYYTGDSGDGTGWTGDPVPVEDVTDGHSIRRKPAGQKSIPDVKESFRLSASPDVYAEPHPTPGNFIDGDAEWIKIDLGLLGIALTEELSSGETTDMHVSATLGLIEAGYVKIDAEIIAYATRDDANLKLLTLTRGCFSTTPATHPIDSSVYQYNDTEDDVYDCHLISAVRWKRRAVLDATGEFYVLPENFDIYISTLASPITPDDAEWDDGAGAGGWQDYWTKISSVRDYEGKTSFMAFFEEKRARFVMLTVLDMTDGGKVKMNEINVYAATGEMIGEGNGLPVVWEGVWSGFVIKDLLMVEFGLAESQITITDDGRPFVDLPVTKGRAGQVFAEICRRTGCQIVYHLDHSVEHRYNPRYSLYSWPSIEVTWDRDNAQDVRYERPFQHNVKQLVLRCSDDIGEESYEARWPPAPLNLGSEMQVEDQIVGSPVEASLMAEYLFRENNAPGVVIITPVGPAEFIRPGERHLVDWEMDAEGTYFQGQNFYVQRVSYSIDFGTPDTPKTWRCSIMLRE